jgi:hypothetical protein
MGITRDEAVDALRTLGRIATCDSCGDEYILKRKTRRGLRNWCGKSPTCDAKAQRLDWWNRVGAQRRAGKA